MEAIQKIDIHAHTTAFPQYAAPNTDSYRMVCAEGVDCCRYGVAS